VANRRAFLAGAGAGAAGVGTVLVTAAAGWPTNEGSGSAPPGQADHGTEAPASSDMSDDEMNTHHQHGIEQFLANIDNPVTDGVGAVDAEPSFDGDVRVFELVCSIVQWQVTPDVTEEAFAYNGVVPGPTLRCVEGERVRVHVRNELPQSTSVHWHGQRVPNDQDGVPFITQDPILPGAEYTYEFVAGPFGTHMYHSHHNSTEQVGKGLLGALLVEPSDRSMEPAFDREAVMILNDALGGFTINGKGFPATPAFHASSGERIRFRFMNEGQSIHPMHLHGLTLEVFARDGYPLPQPFRCDTLTVAPGERWDAIVVADNPGVWAFHCHILSHAEGPSGMFGMVTALIVEEASS
jgi:FtsP/CotA-like multicopper oxidase with cupredoxin domain